MFKGLFRNPTPWEVSRYGQLIRRSDIEMGGVGFITTKIYKYQGKHYVELWNEGYQIHFEEIGQVENK